MFSLKIWGLFVQKGSINMPRKIKFQYFKYEAILKNGSSILAVVANIKFQMWAPFIIVLGPLVKILNPLSFSFSSIYSETNYSCCIVFFCCCCWWCFFFLFVRERVVERSRCIKLSSVPDGCSYYNCP